MGIMKIRRRVFTEKKIALACVAVLVGVSVFPAIKYAGSFGNPADATSVLNAHRLSESIVDVAPAARSAAENVTESPTAGPSEMAPAQSGNEAVSHAAGVESSVGAKADTVHDRTYRYTAIAGGSYTLAVRQAIQAYIVEKGITVDAARQLEAEVAIVNAAGAPSLELGETVTIAEADIAKELPALTKSPEANEEQKTTEASTTSSGVDAESVAAPTPVE